MLISVIPPARRGKSAWAVASLMRLPSPVVERRVPPATRYSATIEPFQAPPAAVTQPVTSAGNAAGIQSPRHVAHDDSRKTEVASFNCSGTAATAEITLKRMYHWPERTSSATEPRPSPTPARARVTITRGDRKSTRLNSKSPVHLVCRLLLE